MSVTITRRVQFNGCGICGKATLEQALATAPPLDDPIEIEAALFQTLPERLRRHQAVFDETVLLLGQHKAHYPPVTPEELRQGP